MLNWLRRAWGMRLRRPILFLYQKLRYGVTYEDCWSLDIYFAKRAVVALKMFIAINRGGMPVIWKEQNNSTDHNALMEEYGPVWEAILWKMLDGFERQVEDECTFEKEEIKYRDECMDLFREYYFNLWD